ncbi:dihydroorotase [Alicyclobacillus macrosporangiidus]|uniref:dihydroorotase n=1 Tax=Alicyclobacillus macrosporangiidus TaxID=392015 RepID=UPI000495E22F|nr:dihydroorotase family protein [Alicyclobacillus macrosporangiidus]
MYDIEIVGAQIVTPSAEFIGCISIQDGKIAAISEKPLGHARKTIDATGLHALPGMIDQHVHFMDPGEEDREDFIHGSTAAATAGVTTVIEHTHGHPVRTLEDFLEKKHHLATRSLVDFGLGAHLWPGYFSEIHKLWENGISFFKAFTCTTHGVPGLTNSELFEAFKEVASVGGVVLAHCEDETMTAKNEQDLKLLNRLDGHVIQEWRSKEAEEVAVSGVVLLAKLTGAKVTIAHVSHPFALELVQRGRELGADVMAEVCPQYMFLDERLIQDRGPFGKFTPPARSAPETKRMMNLLANGSIDILSSDHAPSTRNQKLEGNIWSCQFGLPGVETTLPLMLTAVNRGDISLATLVRVYSETPARRLGLYPNKGSLRVGADADIVLIDMAKKWVIEDANIVSKAGWSPYSGTECIGKPETTIVRGQIVIESGKVAADPGVGQYVSRVSRH